MKYLSIFVSEIRKLPAIVKKQQYKRNEENRRVFGKRKFDVIQSNF